MTSAIIPTMRYHDAPKMIEWLCTAFGFIKHFVVEDGNGGIAHAQLTFGNSMVMLGSSRNDAAGELQATPQTLGGTTQSAYIIVDDVDGVCEQARKTGAEITAEPRDEEYGGRAFSCRDPEGHLWHFGSYDPWKK
ncbi:MAG: VOC family protein [Parvularculales bacterium]